MEAATLHCPDCGAPAGPDARVCGYCGARLATVACPHCFATAFVGMRHCPRCGAGLHREPAPAPDAELPCPRCAGALEAVRVGPTLLRECVGCGGVWLDTATFVALCGERDRLAAVLGRRPPGPASEPLDLPVIYRSCPVCRTLLSRVNFAGRSGVVVDVCRPHGVWFDRGELHRAVDFVTGGGLAGGGWDSILIHFTE